MFKVQRAIEGMTLEDINKKKSSDEQKALKEQVEKELKDRKQKKMEIKQKSKPQVKNVVKEKQVRKDVPRKDKKGKK